MATAITPLRTDYRQEWFEIEDATYLNLAAQSPMPKVAHRAVQTVLQVNDALPPHRVREEVAIERGVLR